MKITKWVIILSIGFILSPSLSLLSYGQDLKYSLRLQIPLLDLPQNKDLSYKYPSMHQAFVWSNSFYDASFYGIDKLSHTLFKKKSGLQKISNYAIGLGFSFYGSELPIPLGVWAHEEFHRSVLGTAGLHPKNGNWFLTRWDGTVFGMSDEELTDLKQKDVTTLLYSYVAGVQSENQLTKENVINDFFYPRTQYKTPLYLYNAYYVWNYFRFSASAESDSVKIKAPEFEDKDPSQRDYAGADLTAWTYDMFNPTESFTSRDPFPGGDGVNRRIGYSDLSAEAQDFISKQKNLALINFLNPAIFFVNRIRINSNYSFMLFPVYSPTHFGNTISVYAPMKIKDRNILIGVNTYSNKNSVSYGVELGYYNLALSKKLSVDGKVHLWNQPEHQGYFDTGLKGGGALEVSGRYTFHKGLGMYTNVTTKTAGWFIGNPYLNKNTSIQLGLSWNVIGS